MSEDWHDPTIGVDGFTCYQRWVRSDAPYKAECKDGLCISYYHQINCEECKSEDGEDE